MARMENNTKKSLKRLGLRNSLTSPKQEKLIPKDKSISLYSFQDPGIYTISKREDQNILDSFKASHTSEKNFEVNEDVKSETSLTENEVGQEGKQLKNPSCQGNLPEITITVDPPSPYAKPKPKKAFESEGFMNMRSLMVLFLLSLDHG